MSNMLTADTITDEQIRELESDVLAVGSTKEKCKMVDLATRALAEIPSFHVALEHVGAHPGAYLSKLRKRRKRARARCAEILNAHYVNRKES